MLRVQKTIVQTWEYVNWFRGSQVKTRGLSLENGGGGAGERLTPITKDFMKSPIVLQKSGGPPRWCNQIFLDQGCSGYFLGSRIGEKVIPLVSIICAITFLGS